MERSSFSSTNFFFKKTFHFPISALTLSLEMFIDVGKEYTKGIFK